MRPRIIGFVTEESICKKTLRRVDEVELKRYEGSELDVSEEGASRF